MYNPSLDVETKMDVALALLKPKAGRKRKRLEALGSSESEDESNTEDESDTEDESSTEDESDAEDEFRESKDLSDEDTDPDYIPKPSKAGKSSIVSTNFNPLQGGSKKYDFKFKKLPQNETIEPVIHPQKDLPDVEGSVEESVNPETISSVVQTQENLSDSTMSIFQDDPIPPKKLNKTDEVKMARKKSKNQHQMVQHQENQFDVESLFEGYEHQEDKENFAPKETGRKYELSSFSNIMDYMKRQQQLKMAEEISRKTDRETMQMLVEASLRREAEEREASLRPEAAAREREDKLLSLLDRLSK